jgi:hypothetical protein
VPTASSGERLRRASWGALDAAYSSARDLLTNELCCIKKVENALQSRGIAKRTLRELIFLRHFLNHENVRCRRAAGARLRASRATLDYASHTRDATAGFGLPRCLHGVGADGDGPGVRHQVPAGTSAAARAPAHARGPFSHSAHSF